mmetsp:Transcript_22665/g.48091  ORF Transcript_22665/g.48091 Transcript_22665/m.48091 type:complete len:116 (+) Transcript_22665:473-820(+)
MRVTFGGSPWPQRFERVALLNCAWIQHVQASFDRANPYPESVAGWVDCRRALQREGRLPEGDEQCLPAGLEPFIDDANGLEKPVVSSQPRGTQPPRCFLNGCWSVFVVLVYVSRR